MDTLPNEYLTELRQAAGPGLWSAAVENSRRDAVTVESEKPGEFHTRVFDSALRRGFLTKLYIQDNDWQCSCGGKQDPCVHVVTAALAIRRAIEKGEALPRSKKNVGKVAYRFWRREDGLKFERYIVGSDAEEVLKVPLTSHMATASDQLLAAPSDQDFSVDVALAQERRGVLKSNTMQDLLKALSGHPEVELDGQAVAVLNEPVGLMLEVRDERNGVRLVGRRDDRILEIFRNGVALTKLGLQPARIPDLDPEDARLIREGGWFGPQQMMILETEMLPRLLTKVRVVNHSARLQIGESAPPRIEVQRLVWDQKIGLVARIVYGDPAIMIVRDGRAEVTKGSGSVARDLDGERRLQDEYRRRTGIGLDEILWLDPDEAMVRVRDWQSRLPHEWLTDPKLRAVATPTRFELCIAGDDLPELSFEGERDQWPDLPMERIWENFQNGRRLIATDDGKIWEIPREWLDRCADLVAGIVEATGSGRPGAALTKVLHAEVAALESRIPPFPGEALSPERWELPAPRLAAGFRGVLRDYQLHGVAWMQWLQDECCGGILADDMGLGKTVQVLSCISAGSLIVAPASLLGNWQREIQKFRPDLPVMVYHGDRRGLAGWESSLVLSSYGIVRADIDHLRSREWKIVVIDEAQNIRNPDSQVAQAVMLLRGQMRLALSGTPMENNLQDLWSLMQFANPGLLGARQNFSRRYSRGSLKTDDARRLRKKIKPFLLRRHKSDVAKELPSKTIMPLMIDLNPTERQIYQALLQQVRGLLADSGMRAKGLMAFLPLLLKMRHACCHLGLLNEMQRLDSSKTEVLIDKFAELIESGHRILVFSQWTKMLDLLEIPLNKNGWRFSRLDGSTVNRSAVVDEFQAPSGPPIMLVSLKAGGVGLNLTAADHVFILDPWWNPAAEDQAADRAYRIGQDKPVFVYKVIARDTIEERVVELQDSKRELVEQLIEGRVAAGGMADVEFLIQH